MKRVRTGFAPSFATARAAPIAVRSVEQKKNGKIAGSTDVAKSNSPFDADCRK